MSGLVAGVDAVLVNTNDPTALARALGGLGWVAEPPELMAAEAAESLFGVRSACEVTALGSPGVSTGRILACRWPDLPALPEGEPVSGLSLGLFSIDLYVRDMEAVPALTGLPWSGGGPQAYEVGAGTTTVRVEEGLLRAPDALALVPVRAARPRATAAWSLDPQRDATELTSVVLATDDVDRTLGFLGPEGLGLPVMYDSVVESAALSEMVGAPAGSVYRLAFLGGDQTARVEVIARQGPPAEAHDLRERQRPAAATGLFGWLVQVADLDRAAAAGTIVGGPVAAFGGRAVALLGPDRNLVVAVSR